jgi:hypothetical protein
MGRAEAQIIPTSNPRAFVFQVSGVSFEELMSIPQVQALARSGGAALMSKQLAGRNLLYAAGLHDRIEGATVFSLASPHGDPAALRGIGTFIEERVSTSAQSEVLVIVAGTSPPSPSMDATKDELFPAVMAEGPPAVLFREGGRLRTLASDTTRRTGVVTDEDVAPTVLAFLGRPIPSGLDGLPLRIVDGPPPFDLHEKYLAMRRMTVPVQTAAGLYVTAGGLLGIGLLWMGRRVPRRFARAAAWIGLSVPALSASLLAAGHLPTLSYATVVPFVVAVTVVGTMALVPLARRDVLLPAAAIGAAVLLFFVAEAAVGWTAAQTPFLGGSELDGGRFFGLPNVFVGLLIGASLYLACRLQPWPGCALVIAVALFAGLPFAGANLGAAVSLFAAAGLWLSLRTAGRMGWRELATAGVIVIAGTVVVLLAHRYLTSTPTHVTRFELAAGHNLGNIWDTITHRLSTGWHLIRLNPFALVPVIGLPGTLFAVLFPPAPVRQGFYRQPAWRDVLLVTLLAGLVAYVANDTGPAAAGLAFGLGLGGLVYVSLMEGTGKMGEP